MVCSQRLAYPFTSPPKLLWAPRNLPLLKMAWEWPPDPKGPGQWSFENIPRFGPKIGTLGTPGGSHGTKILSSEIFSLKNIGVYIEKFMALLSKKMICWWKSDIFGRMEIRAKIWVFLLQKSSFCQKTPKPYYVDLNINVWEHFWRKKCGPMGPPWGTLGPYLGSKSWNVFKTQLNWSFRVWRSLLYHF